MPSIQLVAILVSDSILFLSPRDGFSRRVFPNGLASGEPFAGARSHGTEVFC